MAATPWTTNAHLIVDCVRLGYLGADDLTLDPTYGKGTWWKLWRPEKLVTHDLVTDGVDFRDLPHPDGSFRRAAFDPPYVCVGGRTTTTMPEFHARYGLTAAPRTPVALQAHNDDGLAEVHRVLKRGGTALVKCADYVWSGKLQIGTHRTLCAALALGFELVDRMEHIGRPRPQPPRTRADGQPVRQHHARRNLSTLLVLEKRR
jgi:hypothetical protein